eukprot:TRINITY_DN6119_c1_g1_i3.p1 TRINITY_DN6119_c1_g1~~TRINITY_DN6119_c1_g1_i3.p1  ORF type:complete len:827 (+),score=190.42 TRINITY_DN6119_c1_g1_i3:71-2551(+)
MSTTRLALTLIVLLNPATAVDEDLDIVPEEAPAEPEAPDRMPPTTQPTDGPTAAPSVDDTGLQTPPSAPPSAAPTHPTATPSAAPTMPTAAPSVAPSTSAPSSAPTNPTASPSAAPTMPTVAPSAAPSTSVPSAAPTNPTTAPSATPTQPTAAPSASPSRPTSGPSVAPAAPTTAPSAPPLRRPQPPPDDPPIDGPVDDTQDDSPQEWLPPGHTWSPDRPLAPSETRSPTIAESPGGGGSTMMPVILAAAAVVLIGGGLGGWWFWRRRRRRQFRQDSGTDDMIGARKKPKPKKARKGSASTAGTSTSTSSTSSSSSTTTGRDDPFAVTASEPERVGSTLSQISERVVKTFSSLRSPQTAPAAPPQEVADGDDEAAHLFALAANGASRVTSPRASDAGTVGMLILHSSSEGALRRGVVVGHNPLNDTVVFVIAFTDGVTEAVDASETVPLVGTRVEVVAPIPGLCGSVGCAVQDDGTDADGLFVSFSAAAPAVRLPLSAVRLPAGAGTPRAAAVAQLATEPPSPRWSDPGVEAGPSTPLAPPVTAAAEEEESAGRLSILRDEQRTADRLRRQEQRQVLSVAVAADSASQGAALRRLCEDAQRREEAGRDGVDDTQKYHRGVLRCLERESRSRIRLREREVASFEELRKALTVLHDDSARGATSVDLSAATGVEGARLVARDGALYLVDPRHGSSGRKCKSLQFDAQQRTLSGGNWRVRFASGARGLEAMLRIAALAAQVGITVDHLQAVVSPSTPDLEPTSSPRLSRTPPEAGRPARGSPDSSTFGRRVASQATTEHLSPRALERQRQEELGGGRRGEALPPLGRAV